MSEPIPERIFHWRLTNDAEAVYALHCAVNAKAPPGTVRPDPLSHFEYHTGERGLTMGCFLDNGELAAYGVLGIQSPTVEHLAELLHADLTRLCVLDGAATRPEWRNYGLHLAAINERIQFGRNMGRTFIAATVAPENIRSLRNLFQAGFEVHRYAVLYSGLARLVVQRDLTCAEQTWQHELPVEVHDHQGHQNALAAGLLGYACVRDDLGAWVINYGHPVRPCL